MNSAPLNLVLIGMPGCGKSSVGARVAKRLRLPLLDTDEMVESRAGQTISELFATAGEAVFRDLETACAQEAASCHGVVIATGGGMILRPENMAALADNGLIVFLDRHPDRILSGTRLLDRPLVRDKADKLWQLYHDRLPLYQTYAAHTVGNTGKLRQVVYAVTTLYRTYQRMLPCDFLSSTVPTSTSLDSGNPAFTDTEPTQTCVNG